MRRAVRVAVLAAAGALALAFAGSALAAYTPRLYVFQTSPRLSGGGQTLLEFATDRTDEATAKLTIYAPAGYQASISQAPGTQVGTAEATVQARAVSQDVFLPVEGTIQADSPSTYMGTPGTTACIGSATPQNVWVLVLTASGRTLRVPVYVYAPAGGEATFASVKLVVCLPPPDVPESLGGAAFGAKVVDALLSFNPGVFTTPAARGAAMWIAYATPYTNFRPPGNAAGTVQARALVPLPVTITLTVKFDKKRKQAVLTGTITAPGANMAGARLQIFAGPRANNLKRSGSTGRVSQRGAYSARKRIARTTFFQVLFAASAISDQAGCAVATTAPAVPGGCTASTNVVGFSRIARAVFRR